MAWRTRGVSARAAVRAVVLAIAVLQAGVASLSVAAPSVDGQRLVFLLEYVGTDYGAAVRDGKVVNELEYGEVLRFTRDLRQQYGALGRASHRVASGLERMERLITDRAPAHAVWTLTHRLVPKVARTARAVVRPVATPNLASGRRLWANDCALCHGGAGAGDGWAAPDMNPPPTAFRGDFLDRLSPRQIYDAVTLGVPGTAMPSFADAYTNAQRWDVAFFAMTLRVGFTPRRPPSGEPFTVDQLARSSNSELLTRLRATLPGATPENLDYMRVTLTSPSNTMAPVAGNDATATGALGAALQLQDAFSAVAARVYPRTVGVSGYVRDPSWTTEKLHVERGDGWIAANLDALRYPGFRRIRTGSGILLDDDGFVATSNHLVRDDAGALAALVEIELPDEARTVASVVGSEPMLDLAIVRAAGTPPKPGVPLELGDSDHAETGHWLISLGDPPGPDRTFSVGVVAAAPLRQCYQMSLSATRLQSSLVISDGAVGGPVVDIQGHLLGMGIRVDDGGGGPPTTGVLPVNLVLYLSDALKVSQSNRSPWLGVSVLELPILRHKLGAQAATAHIPPTGVAIDDVFDPSPASRAGIRPGDFLVGLGGHPIYSVGDFQTWLYVGGVGTTTEIDVVRDGKPMKVKVPIEARPRDATTY
jgi:S1-C subfamily serine protease/mono/diheme cytochrome c family protein